MAIELDISRVAAQTASVTAQDAALTQTSTAQKLASLLGGESLKVSSGAMTDLEALVAKLKNEQEKTKFSLLVSSLNAIRESLTASQKAAVEEGLKLTEQVNTLKGDLAKLESTLSTAQGASLLLQTQIDALEKQIEQAVQDGKDHNELVAKQKELRKELDAKNDTIKETQGKIDATKNVISAVNGKIAAVVKSIGENTLKTIANEIVAINEPKNETISAEQENKAEAKAEANDPFNAILESLDRLGRELADTIEKNVETMV